MTGKDITLMADFSGATATIMTAEGENEARVYRFTVVDVGGAVINLESEGAEVALYIMRPGAPVQIGAEINGSTATITIPSGACSVPGRFAAWLQIVTSTYDLRVDGMEFVVKANAIDDGAQQAEAEFGLLTEMIQEGQAAIEKMESYFPTSIENGGTGATTAEAARENLGITLPLSIQNGGTGETNLSDAITAMMEAVTPVSVTNFAEGVSPASTGGGLESAKVQVRKIGILVCLEGSVEVKNFAGEYLALGTLPSGYAPAGTVVFYATLTGSRVARFQIAKSGVITLNWVYNADGTEYTGDISWLQLNSMWLV
ncbi:MAG: hypothetical protein ACLUUJ_04995 [Acutalibacteraceae bacterium]